MNRIAALLSILLAAGALAACGHGSGDDEGSVRAVGMASINGGPVASGSTVHLRRGDALTVTGGEAFVTLPGGGRLELRPGSMVGFEGGPALVGGDLLVQSPSHGTVAVRSPVGGVSVAGVAWLRRDLAFEIGTYQGRSTVTTGRTLIVPALEQDTLPAVGLVPAPSPLHVSPSDPWDQRFMGAAIELTSELDAQSRYVSANVPAAQRLTAAFFRKRIDGLSATPLFTDALLNTAAPVGGTQPPPGEALVAAAVALAGPGPFADRWQAIFDLRHVGAQWGIVVLGERASGPKVLSLIEGAVDRGDLAPPPSLLSSNALPVQPVIAPTVTGAPAAARPTTPTTVLSAGSVQAKVKKGPSATPAYTAPKSATPTTTSPPTTSPALITLPPPVLAPVVDPVLGIIRGLLGSPPPAH